MKQTSNLLRVSFLLLSLHPTLQQEPEICYEPGCISAAEGFLSTVNFSVNPCDDFHQFACGKWLSDNPIPPSEAFVWRLGEAQEKLNNATREILSGPESPDEPLPLNLAVRFYRECMNIDEINSAGVEPLKTILANFGSWSMLNNSEWTEGNFNLSQQISTFNKLFNFPALLSIKLDRNMKDSSEPYLIAIDQPTLGLPESILLAPEIYSEIIEAYKTFIVELAVALGSVESVEALEVAAQNIITFETQLANITRPGYQMFDPALTFNPFTVQEFQEYVDSIHGSFGLDWKSLLSDTVNESGVEIDESQNLMVLGKSYVEKLIPILESTPPRVISDYMQVYASNYLAQFSTTELRAIRFNFNKLLTGLQEPPSLETNCRTIASGWGIASMNNNFAIAISHKYIRDYADQSVKAITEGLYNDIASAFTEMLENTDWMDNVTKTEALGKIQLGKAYIGYPEWILNASAIEYYYEGLSLSPGHLEGMMSLEKWSNLNNFKKIGKHPSEQDEWYTYPNVLNAFYWPFQNAIFVPAGILQSPPIQSDRPAYTNYAAIGFIMAHEITHGYDNQGAKYDKYGNAVDWWLPETLDEFNRRGQCFVDQYSKFYMPNVDMYVNGVLTLGENIADNGGFIAALRAYEKYVDRLGKPEPRLPGIEQYTPEQLFFMSYANGCWCDKYTDEYMVGYLLSNTHSPSEARINEVMKNMPEFSSAFQCPVGSPMNPTDKCKVWA